MYKPVSWFSYHPRDGVPIDTVMQQARDRGVWQGEVVGRDKNGDEIPGFLTLNQILGTSREIVGFVVSYVDLRPIRQAETKLRESEATFRAITTAAQDAILMLDDTGCIVFWNDAASRILGYESAEAAGQDALLLLAPERHHDAYRAAWTQFTKSGHGVASGKVIELEARRKNGSEFPVELSVSSVLLHDRWHAVGIMRDITQRKETEQSLRRSNRALRTLSSCNAILVHATDENQLMDDMCRAIVDSGYALAWIGLVDPQKPASWHIEAHAAADKRYDDLLIGDWAEFDRAGAPAGEVLRSGAARFVDDIRTAIPFPVWGKLALERNVASVAALPLAADNGKTFGVLKILSGGTAAFDDDERDRLQELASDFAYGIRSLRTRLERDHYRAEHQKSEEQLRHALLDIIRAIGLTLEKRDPYTGGHQARVADVAVAIAHELGLGSDRIEGLKLGAMIHDIGKISIPSEFLARSGPLSKVEYEVVKSHAEVGYDIVKDIQFPWPVANMVLQHHERLDGSGYPKGLTGDAICLEARVLAVADVVEAISSHRPYRPALGVDKALDEIEAGKGARYDSAVVDACLRLFREKGYTLPAPPP